MGQKKLLQSLDIKNFIKKNSFEFIDSEIVATTNLSKAFGCICEKFTLNNGKKFVLKYQNSEDAKKYPSIYYEGKSIEKLNKLFNELFPKIFHIEKNFFIMNWIEHNNEVNNESESELAFKLSKLHLIKNNEFGYEFNSPIGGLEQPSSYEKSWINFYKIKRLQMIFDVINNRNPMPKNLNRSIQKIIDNLEKFIPECNSPSLIHGDLWSGNILYNNGKLAGLIDPSIYFANNELELSSLSFLNVVSNKFFEKYSQYIEIESGFKERLGIYELYYCLLNIHLWSRSYINYAEQIVKKYI